MINIKKFDSVALSVKEVLQQEALKGDQHKIDKNKNNKIDAHDFKILRGEKKAVKEDAVEESNNPFDVKNYKSQLPTKPGEKAGFDSKKISTGTVYSRKPVKDEPMKKEEVEQIDEALPDIYSIKNTKTGQIYHNSKFPITQNTSVYKKIKAKGGEHIHATIHKNGKPIEEEVEQVDERTLTKGETKEKERIVKGMKKSLKGFKARYGEKAKSVMYATATKAAKNEEVVTEAKRPESDTVPFMTNGDSLPLQHAKNLAKKSMKRLKSEMMGKTGTSE